MFRTHHGTGSFHATRDQSLAHYFQDKSSRKLMTKRSRRQRDSHSLCLLVLCPWPCWQLPVLSTAHDAPRPLPAQRRLLRKPHQPHHQRVKIGRQTNPRTVPAENNGYFDSKVLSRQTVGSEWRFGRRVGRCVAGFDLVGCVGAHVCFGCGRSSSRT